MLAFLDLWRPPCGIWVGAQAVEDLFTAIAPNLVTKIQAEKLHEMRQYYNQSRYKQAFRIGTNLQANITHGYIPLYCDISDFPDPLVPPNYLQDIGTLYGAIATYELSDEERKLVVNAASHANASTAKIVYHLLHGVVAYQQRKTSTPINLTNLATISQELDTSNGR